MQEEVLYFFWQVLAASQETVRLNGHDLQVLAAGQLNRQRGPDFTAARFRLDGTVYQADVECHVRPSDWYRHLHHLDPTFSRVVLHLTLFEEDQTVEHSLTGMPVTTVVVPLTILKRVLSKFKSRHFQLKPVSSGDVDFFKILALQRLQTKTRGFLSEYNLYSWPQLFYAHMFRALGYSANRGPFQQLAYRFPWEQLKSWLQEDYLSFDTLYAIYAGQAGFLDSLPVPDSYTSSLQKQYRLWTSTHDLPPFDVRLWQWAGQRRGNHPHFRLAGGLAFFKEYGSSAFEQCLDMARKRQEFNLLYAAWKRFLNIPCSDYWQRHLALSLPLKNGKNRLFIGLSRQQEIILNVFVPLLLARAWLQESFGFAEYLQAFYLWIPFVTAYSSLSKRFPWDKKILQLWPAQALYQALIQLQSTPSFPREEISAKNPQELLPSIDTDSQNSYNLNSG